MTGVEILFSKFLINIILILYKHSRLNKYSPTYYDVSLHNNLKVISYSNNTNKV